MKDEVVGWARATRKAVVTPSKPQLIAAEVKPFTKPEFPIHAPDLSRLVTIDFETYWDQGYTLSKLSTSEYVRDPRFRAQMMGIKIGTGKTRIIPHHRIKTVLAGINWATHSLLCHNTLFDGFILSHHYGVHPAYLYDTLAMARGLHSNDIGAGLEEVSRYYKGPGKVAGGLDGTKGVRIWSPELYAKVGVYCTGDVDETRRVFGAMLPKMPADEIELIHLICKMFCSPTLLVDLPRVQAELTRELKLRRDLMLSVIEDPEEYDDILKGKDRKLEDEERHLMIARKVLGSNERFAELLRAEGVEPPTKTSPAWLKKDPEEREGDGETYAFAKDDTEFINLPESVVDSDADDDTLRGMLARRERLQGLVDARLIVKSTTNVTRAERFLTAGANGMPLPVGYAYSRAHTHRLGGNNKMNMQNLVRGGELRQSILAPPGYEIGVVDSGQIEARFNGWLWKQEDLLAGFRASDSGTGKDAYCNFGDLIYPYEVTTDTKVERFVGKVCLAADTSVLTNQGLKSIIDVCSTDLLWDGESWVRHAGLIPQGEKEVLRMNGLAATPDHEILTERGWREWQKVLTDPSLFQSALSLANSQSCGGNTTSQKTASPGATGRYVDVLAEQRTWSTPTASSQGDQPGAILALRWPQAQNGTGSTKTPWKTTAIAQGCLTAYRQLSAAVKTLITLLINTTVYEAFQCFQNGSPTAPSFSGTPGPSKDGITLSSKWIESTTTAPTHQATSASPLNPLTPVTSGGSRISSSEFVPSKQRTQTYDLANAGPNKRFAVMTDGGLIVVHNCVLGLGFSMGPEKLRITLAKGALGGKPMIFTPGRCHEIVQTYRATNARIVFGWEICAHIISEMSAGRSGSYGVLNWEKETIWLPNGMRLQYPDLQYTPTDEFRGEWTYRAGKMRKKIYGGLLCENIIQALARVAVMWQLLLISRKLPVVMTTHDEVAALLKIRRTKTEFEFMFECMRRRPPWCSDIPLNCEGGHSPNYSK